MNISEIAPLLKKKGHKNAYQKLNFLKNGAIGMIPKDSVSFFDDAIAIIKEGSKQDVETLLEQKKAYLKLKK